MFYYSILKEKISRSGGAYLSTRLCTKGGADANLDFIYGDYCSYSAAFVGIG